MQCCRNELVILRACAIAVNQAVVMQLKKQYVIYFTYTLILIKHHIVNKLFFFTPIGIYGKVIPYMPVNTLADW